MRYLAVLLACALSGCQILSPSFESLAERPWVEVESPSFRILSDAGIETATRLCEELELFRAVVAQLSSRPLPTRVPTTVFAFRSAAPVVQLARDRSVAGFMSPSLRGSRVVLSTDRGSESVTRHILFHEYTHFLLHNDGELLYPRWFDEGYAELLGATSLRKDEIVVGAFPQLRYTTALYLDPLPAAKVITARSLADWPDSTVSNFYWRAWQIVHYLILSEEMSNAGGAQKLARYLRATPAPGDEERVWRETFGMDFAALDSALSATFRKQSIRARGMRRSSLQVEPVRTSRSLLPADVATELGWLTLAHGQIEPAARLFERALQHDPSASRAHAGLGDVAKFQGRWSEAEPHYRRALELGADEFENHLEFAEWAMDYPTPAGESGSAKLALAREHFERAIALAPEIPESHAMLGATYLKPEQDPERGIPHAQRAALLLPSSERGQLVLAQLYLAAGEHAAARRRLERVLGTSHATLIDQAQSMLAELDARERNASAPAD